MTSAPTRWVLRWQWGVALVALILHAWINAGAFFHNDDFLYLVWAQDPVTEALLRVYNNHLMPLGFAVVVGSQALAPLSWPLAALILTALWAITLVGLVLFVRRAFGDSLWSLAPLVLIGLGPLPAAVSVWYASGLQFLPWVAVLVWTLYFAIRDAQSPGKWWWLLAVVTYAVGLGFWQKGLLAAPVVVWLAWRYWPGGGRFGLRGLGRRWLLPAGIALVSLAYLPVYFLVQQSQVLPASPRSAEIWDMTRVMIGEVLIPGLFGMPWGAYARDIDAHVDSAWPWWGSVLLIELVVLLVSCSVMRWRAAWNAWVLMAGYAAVTIALFALGRSHVVGLVLAYDARYVEDLYAVVAISLPFAFVRPRGSVLEMPRALSWERILDNGVVRFALAFTLANALILPTISVGLLWRSNPGREFVESVVRTIEENPGVPLVDRKLPGDVMADFFLEDRNLSRVMGALRKPIDWDGSGPRILAFGDDGRPFEPSIEVTARSVPGLDGDCGYSAFGSPRNVELDATLFEWIWLGSMDYLSAAPGEASLALGSGAAIPVPLEEGAHSVRFVIVGGGDTLTLTPPPGVGVCISGVTLGQPGQGSP